MDSWNPAAFTPDDAEAQGAGVRELNQDLKQATTFECYQQIYRQALHRRQGGDISAPLDTAYHTIADLAQRHMLRLATCPRGAVLIRGAGDVGSAIAHRLLHAGYTVVLQDGPTPTTLRRGMAFTDAIFDEQAVLADVTAVRLHDLTQLASMLYAHPQQIPIVVDDLLPLITLLKPTVLIDARMRKCESPEEHSHLAPLTIGLGPGFFAGETTHLVIETSWEGLGTVITSGTTRPLSGEPRPLGGAGRERFIYAERAGVLETPYAIGDSVTAGQSVGQIVDVSLIAPLTGVLRGLVRPGVAVLAGTKVVEVDPRGAAAQVHGLGERPQRIATGVLAAMQQWQIGRPTDTSDAHR